MLTPQEVQEKTFAKAVFGGYDMAGVDEFIEELSADYAALYKESAILKSKLKLLVDKVEEYRSTEDAMRQALLDAQKKRDEMISDAQKQSEEILAEARAKSDAHIAGIHSEIEAEERRLALARESTAEYVDMIRSVCSRQIEFLDGLGRLPVDEQPPEEEKLSASPSEEEWISDTAKEIELSLKRLEETPRNNDLSEDDTKPFVLPRDDEEDLFSTKARFNFENLQFGTNYSTDEEKD